MRLIDADAVYDWYRNAFKDIRPNEIRFSMLDIKYNLDNIPTIATFEHGKIGFEKVSVEEMKVKAR